MRSSDTRRSGRSLRRARAGELVGDAAAEVERRDVLTWLSNQWKRLRAFEKRNRYRGTVPRNVADEREHPADRVNMPGTKDHNPGGSWAGQFEP